MSFLSWFTGGSTTVDKGLDMIERGVDMAVFTGEERSLAHMKKLEWRLDWIKAIGPQSKARRYIAYLVASLWVYLVVLGVHLHLFGYVEQATYVYEVLKDVVGMPFAGIMSFYFITNIVRANK